MCGHSWYSSRDGDQAQTTDAACFRANHLVDRQKETTVWAAPGGGCCGPLDSSATSQRATRCSLVGAATRGHPTASACTRSRTVESPSPPRFHATTTCPICATQSASPPTYASFDGCSRAGFALSSPTPRDGSSARAFATALA